MNSTGTFKRTSILFAVNEIFPDTHGGVHTYIYEIAKRLAAMGYSICVLTKKVNENSPQVESIDGFTVHRYEAKIKGFSLFCQVSAILSIRKAFNKLCASQKFDLLNLHSPHAAWGINLSKKAKKIPKIYTFYALLAEEEFYNASGIKYRWYQWQKYIKPFWFSLYLFLSRWLEKKALESADKIISLSQFTSGCITRVHNIVAEKIVQIPAGVDSERFKPATDKAYIRKALGLPQNKFVLFTVRRLVARMGLDNLIRAMPLVLENYPDAFLVIGGQGPLYLELKSLIDKHNLDNKIILTGFIPYEKLPLYYQAADLFVLPSIAMEGFGVVTLEALACGVPVLATPIGGSVEILSALDKNLLFKDDSPEAIANLIIQYITDEQKRKQIEGRSRKFILDNYTWENAVKRTEELFLAIAESRK